VTKPDQDHDPFDPEYVRSRRKAGPRLVDLTQPLPEPDPGPPVARPYAPQKKIRPEAVVPPEDNPMVGWRWIGARLLSRTLWPRDAITNPVMAYYTGRRRGRATEDLVGLAPWLLWLAFDLWFMLVHATTFRQITRLGVLEFVVGGAFAYAWSAAAVAMHVRRAATNLPVEEMLLTRLSPVDIVQGLSIRPIAVQSAAVLLWSAANLVASLVAAWLIEGAITPRSGAYALVLVTFRYWLFGSALESGGSYAMRAHMCIRSTLAASLRMFLDLAVMVAIFLATCGLVALGALAMAWSFGGGGGKGGAIGALLVIVAAGVLCLILFAGVSFLFVSMRNLGGDAMDFCINHPEEWWFRRAEEDRETEEARSLFSAWRPTEKGRIVWRAPSPPNKQA